MRLGEAIRDTILEYLSAFVAGRQILDARLVANEVVEDLKGKKQRV